MKIQLLTLCLICLSITLQAQNEIINTSSELLQKGEYDLADHYLDSIITAAPNTVDALMMKGNVVLSRALSTQASIALTATNDESIYDETIGEMGEMPKYVDKETAEKVETLWLKCIHLAPDRLDIYQGLCTLYGMALMKDKLLKELPLLVKATPAKNDDLAYSLENYALAFEERNDFNDCMAVYKKNLDLFPQSGGLVGDMAVMYQKHGHMKEAVQYARQSAAMKGSDFITCYNVASIIALGADIEEANKIFTSSKDASPLLTYYQGIIQFYHNDPAWHESLSTFLKKYKSKSTDDGRIELANVLIADSFKMDSAGYEAAMATQPYEFEYLLLSTKAQNALSNKYDPMLRLANLYARKSSFDKAVQVLRNLKSIPKTTDQDSTYYFDMAYALYKSGAEKESATYWKMFTDAGSIFRQSAACYFLGMIYDKEGKKNEAKALYTKTAGRASESKFANFCAAKMK